MVLSKEGGSMPLIPHSGVVRIALIGYGYWGPLLVRNFTRQSHTELSMIVDLSDSRLAEAQRNHPFIPISQSFDDVIAGDIDAVSIATPVGTHFALTKQALMCGKHVLVEKPMTFTSAESLELIQLAQDYQRVLMVGHTFEYSPEVEYLRNLVTSGELGKIYYINSSRLNLGIIRQDADVIWDLAPHDISMINYILGSRPISVRAYGTSHLHSSLIDVANLDLAYTDNVTAHILVSWLNPNKERILTIVGDKRMVRYDDTAGNEKIKIYNRGIDRPEYSTSFSEFQYSYRYGDILIPSIPGNEPLAVECRHFIESIRNGEQPRSNGTVGHAVVKVLEMAHHSIDEGGHSVDISW